MSTSFDRHHQAILPGSTLGVLGSGQLGRMFAIAARQMGYRVYTYSPDTDSPTGQVADKEVVGSYDDFDAVRAFASSVDVMTFEFENVPTATANAAAEKTILRPSGHVLHIAQHRSREKTFLRDHGFPVTPFTLVHTVQELQEAAKTIGLPAILKTAGWGYDGKGQIDINSQTDLSVAWATLDTREAVLEKRVDFLKELSVVATRSFDGQTADFGVMENVHANHILDVTVWPAFILGTIRDQAIDLAHQVLRDLDVVGVMCVEMFLTTQGQILINELAPRPHNSGHLTIESHATSQFEQQVRAVCGLPLGSTEPVTQAAAMANIMGEVWQTSSGYAEPDWAAALSDPNIKLHLYGKTQPRKGRKMGHLTALGGDIASAVTSVKNARSCLTRSSDTAVVQQ